MGNLGLSMSVDAVEQELWGQLLLDLLVESLDIGDDSVEVLCRLSVLIFSSVLCIGGTGPVTEGNLHHTG